MKKSKNLKILKEYYKSELLHESFYGSVILLESYTDKELLEIFKNDNYVKKYLEEFILKCYMSKIILENTPLKEIFEIKEYLKNDINSKMFILELDFLKTLKNMADYFTEIDLNSLARKYYEEKISSINNYKLCKDLLEKMPKYNNEDKLWNDLQNEMYFLKKESCGEIELLYDDFIKNIEQYLECNSFGYFENEIYNYFFNIIRIKICEPKYLKQHLIRCVSISNISKIDKFLKEMLLNIYTNYENSLKRSESYELILRKNLIAY